MWRHADGNGVQEDVKEKTTPRMVHFGPNQFRRRRSISLERNGAMQWWPAFAMARSDRKLKKRNIFAQRPSLLSYIFFRTLIVIFFSNFHLFCSLFTENMAPCLSIGKREVRDALFNHLIFFTLFIFYLQIFFVNYMKMISDSVCNGRWVIYVTLIKFLTAHNESVSNYITIVWIFFLKFFIIALVEKKLSILHFLRRWNLYSGCLDQIFVSMVSFLTFHPPFCTSRYCTNFFGFKYAHVLLIELEFYSRFSLHYLYKIILVWLFSLYNCILYRCFLLFYPSFLFKLPNISR